MIVIRNKYLLFFEIYFYTLYIYLFILCCTWAHELAIAIWRRHDYKFVNLLVANSFFWIVLYIRKLR